MKVLVCGGRDYSNLSHVFATLHDINYLRPITALIHGGAKGADSLADAWAKSMGVERIACPANWAAHGRKAGPLRNRQMLTHKPDLVVAFPGGRGTADMMRAAIDAGLPVQIVSDHMPDSPEAK